MPTIDRRGPYRIFFYSNEGDEPAHVHVERDDKVAKFWLDGLRLADAGRFSKREIVRIRELVGENLATYWNDWNEYFDA